jgi:hypothetical protein
MERHLRENFMSEGKEPGLLSEIANFVESVDPLSGPNVMRRAAQIFTDNGDGTMTMRRSSPFAIPKPSNGPFRWRDPESGHWMFKDMRASDLIAELQKAIAEHGDLPVGLASEDYLPIHEVSVHNGTIYVSY